MPLTTRDKQNLTIRAWYRVAFGVILSVVVSLVIVSSTYREAQIKGCGRASLDRIDTARKDSRDAIRERVLALDSGTSKAVRDQHQASFVEAARAAASYLDRAGLSSYDSPDAIVHINPDAPEIKADRTSFCEAQYRAPFPLSLIG